VNKYITLPFYLFCFFISVAQNNAKSIKVSYALKINAEMDLEQKQLIKNNKSYDEYTKSSLLESDPFSEYQDFVTFKLLGNNKEYIFYKELAMLPESIKPLQKKTLEIVFSSSYYRNEKTDDFYRTTNFSGKDYLVIIQKDDVKWEILPDTLKIDNYICYKAKGTDRFNKVFYAWFTPELNYNFGPMNSLGLPGTVLQYEVNKFSLVCTKIEFVLKEEDLKKIKRPNGQEIKEEDFDAIVKKARGNFGG